MLGHAQIYRRCPGGGRPSAEYRRVVSIPFCSLFSHASLESRWTPAVVQVALTGSFNSPFGVSKFSKVQELCESRGGRPGLPVLMSLTVSVDVKQH